MDNAIAKAAPADDRATHETPTDNPAPHRTPSGDCIAHGTAAGGMIRALAITAVDTVQAAQDAHGMALGATAALGRLMMAAQMMGSLFKNPGEYLSLIVQCAGELGGLTVTADTEGNVKGYAKNPQAGAVETDVAALVEQGALTVVRNSPHVEPYVSQIALVNGTIADDLTAYYIVSEQIPTIVALDVQMGVDGRVARAGGYFVQLMPGYDEALLGKLEEAVSAAGPVAAFLERGLAPDGMLDVLLGGLDFKLYEQTPAAFRCDCSRDRSERTLMSLGADELRAMVEEGNPIDIKCDFCGKTYTFTVDELRALAG